MAVAELSREESTEDLAREAQDLSWVVVDQEQMRGDLSRLVVPVVTVAVCYAERTRKLITPS